MRETEQVGARSGSALLGAGIAVTGLWFSTSGQELHTIAPVGPLLLPR
jgi:hypothetical protein